jgi:hypothetical protein
MVSPRFEFDVVLPANALEYMLISENSDISSRKSTVENYTLGN